MMSNEKSVKEWFMDLLERLDDSADDLEHYDYYKWSGDDDFTYIAEAIRLAIDAINQLCEIVEEDRKKMNDMTCEKWIRKREQWDEM